MTAIVSTPLKQLKKLLILSEEELKQIDLTHLPRHVAIIPDGNRRWAKNQNVTCEKGHSTGADNLMDIVRAGKDLGIKVLTFFCFSTENWRRDEQEVAALMWLLESYLYEQQSTMLRDGVRFSTIGDVTRFPSSVIKAIDHTQCVTENCQDIEMVFALNYGGRDEILRAFQAMLRDYDQGALDPAMITEDTISQYLDTHPYGDPDLLIRTSGEYRMSNFLIWQTSYTEFYTSHTFWPDFTPQHFVHALQDFQQRQRRLGGK